MVVRNGVQTLMGICLVACSSRGVCDTPGSSSLPASCEFVYDKDVCTSIHGTFHPLSASDDDKVWQGQKTCSDLGFSGVNGPGKYFKKQ